MPNKPKEKKRYRALQNTFWDGVYYFEGDEVWTDHAEDAKLYGVSFLVPYAGQAEEAPAEEEADTPTKRHGTSFSDTSKVGPTAAYKKGS